MIDSRDTPGPVCAGCGAPLFKADDVCTQCDAAAGAAVELDGASARRPFSAFVLVGVWLIAAYPGFVGTMMIIDGGSDASSLIPIGSLLLLFSAVLGLGATRKYFHDRSSS